jgi:predicted phosphodiesterase
MAHSNSSKTKMTEWGHQTMIIGVFGDVHGNLPALEAVLDDGKHNGVARWLCLGDMAFRGPAPEECMRLIRGVCGDSAVMGNTEEWLPVGPPQGEATTPERQAMTETWWRWTIGRLDNDDLQWVRSLPLTRTFEFGANRLLCVHATARGPDDGLLPTAPDGVLRTAFRTSEHSLAACAHTHTPYLRRLDKCTVFNTGSTGRPVDGDPRSSYVILDLDLNHGAASVNFRRVGYDVERTVLLAKEREFPWAGDYETALRNGVNF